jgi:hypothetical protein
VGTISFFGCCFHDAIGKAEYTLRDACLNHGNKRRVYKTFQDHGKAIKIIFKINKFKVKFKIEEISMCVKM